MSNFDNILLNWEKVSEEAFHSLLNESNYNIDAKLALNMRKSGNLIYIDNYVIKIKKTILYQTEKCFYDIIDLTEDKNIPLYSDICLFDTVLVILKVLLKEKRKPLQNDPLLVLDTKYCSVLSSLIYYKDKIKISNDEKKHIYMAKYDGDLISLSRISNQIKNFDK